MRAIIFWSLFISAVATYGQQDSTVGASYDMVYLKSGAILKGDIMSFNEKEGSLVFKDTEQRVYSLTRDEYLYFKENVLVATKKVKEIRPRKYDELEYGVGFAWSNLIGPDYRYNIDNGSLSSSFGAMPFCAKVAVGKYFKGESYVGVTSELALTSGAKNYVNGGLRYVYTFTSMPKNALIYIPAELKYHYLKSSVQLYGDVENEFFNYAISSVGANLGTGLSFTRANKKSISLEIMLTKHFPQPIKISNMPERAEFSSGEMRFLGGTLVFMYNI